MDEFDWKRIEDLFEQGVSLDSQQQARFLDRECAEQPELRRHVEELLVADQQLSKTWPGLSFGEPGDTQPEADSTDAEQPEIPGYRCIRRLGAGGMGIVYLALRQDEVFEGRAFAIKVLHAHRVGESARKRFVAERRLLAVLDHPGIVRIYDGGELADGRPYLVMDYVEGRSLTRYCDAEKKSIQQRLALFREVCLALHHAHQNLVVHRDLKPSNILVNAESVPHLLDFGIAKRLPKDAGDMATTGMVPMTPAYASPEQIAGHAVTTASDLYSLGVILHELLVGALPDPDEDSARPSRYLATLTKVEDVSEARGTTPARLRRQVEGDLDHIAAKLLRSEPEARYASARELAEDIDRHLTDKPILARRGSWRYVTGRFIRRRRVGLIASCASLLVLVLAVIAWVQTDRLQRSEETTRQLDRIMRRLTGPPRDSLLPLGGLDEVTSMITDLDFSEEGKTLMVDIVRRLHLPEDQVLAEALEVLHQASEEKRVDGKELADLAYSFGQLLFEANRFVDSEKAFRLAVTTAQREYESDDPSLAPYLSFHGRVLAELERYDEGAAVLRRSINLGGDERTKISTFSELAGLLFLKGSFAESAAAYRQGLALHEGQAEGSLMERAILLSSLAVALVEVAKGDPTGEAEAAAREALAIHLDVTGRDHIMTLGARNNLAVVLERKGKIVQAIDVAEENIEEAERVLSPDHPRMAYMRTMLASAFQMKGDSAECERQARLAVDLRQRKLPAGSWLTALSHLTLGSCLADLGRLREAREVLGVSVYGMTLSKVEDEKWLKKGKAELARVEELLAHTEERLSN